jgi:hypothetical protein
MNIFQILVICGILSPIIYTRALIAPGFLLRKEREGLIVGSKSYYYVAIHAVLS